MDPYAVLGIGMGANRDAVRRAFRRWALKTHPDRNPHDRRAPERFRRVVDAYQQLACSWSEAACRPQPPAPPPPAPYVCGYCGDGFTFQAPCPRCQAETWPRDQVGPAPPDPRVQTMLEKLEETGEIVVHDGFVQKCPELLACAYVGLGAALSLSGPFEAAVMLTAFGCLWMAVALNARLRLFAT